MSSTRLFLDDLWSIKTRFFQEVFVLLDKDTNLLRFYHWSERDSSFGMAMTIDDHLYRIFDKEV